MKNIFTKLLILLTLVAICLYSIPFLIEHERQSEQQKECFTTIEVNYSFLKDGIIKDSTIIFMPKITINFNQVNILSIRFNNVGFLYNDWQNISFLRKYNRNKDEIILIPEPDKWITPKSIGDSIIFKINKPQPK